MIIFTAHPCQSAEEGQAAPPFEAKLFNGEPFSLATAKHKVVIIHFWAPWCESCVSEMAILDDYYKLHHSEGLELVAVNMDSNPNEAKARELMKPLSFPAAMAKTAHYKGYGRIWRLPLTFVIDRKGVLRKDGWAQNHLLNRADLDAVIGPLLKGTSP